MLAVALALAAPACTGDDGATPTTSLAATTTTTIPPRPADGTLSLGALLPRTGPGASLGEPMINSVRGAIEMINAAGGVLGQPVRLEVADESGDTGLEDLLAAGVDAIVGPASSLVALSQLGTIVDPSTGVVTCSPSATALALDDFPDNDFFFRTVPSDSLQMLAIARRVQRTGATSVAIGYLDDPYGRGLNDALTAEIEATSRIEIVDTVPFSPDQEDLSAAAATLVAGNPGLVVVLGDADDGGRFIAALDEATATVQGRDAPQVIVNDALRAAHQTMQTLDPQLREQISGVAPLARSYVDGGPEGAFAANAADCVNLIALAAEQVGSDAPTRIRGAMSAVSSGGAACAAFADCADLLDRQLEIDYNGLSGPVELSPSTGDLVRAWFEVFEFDETGLDVEITSASPFDVF